MSLQESQESATRDSGIETGSCFTSSEDSHKAENVFQKRNPVLWQKSADGNYLFGHITLQKNMHNPVIPESMVDPAMGGIHANTANTLGIKIIGRVLYKFYPTRVQDLEGFVQNWQ